MGKATSILQLFSDLSCQGSINQLVEISYKTAIAYLRHNSTRIVKLLNDSELTFSETAISSITTLFCPNKEDNSLPIVKEFNAWQPPIQKEDDAIYFLNKVIARRVDQYITCLLKEHDPFFAKILDSVNYMVKRSGFKKVSHFGKRYIIPDAANEIEGKVIDDDSFEKLPYSLFNDPKNFLINIFAYLEGETTFLPAIPVNMLVKRLRELNHLSFLSDYNSKSTSSKLEVDEIVDRGLEHVIRKLESSYAVTNKLCLQEIELFRHTLKNIAEDLKNGGINPGLYEYFKQHADAVDKKMYQEKYHNILEYLLKVMKNHIKEKILVETR